MWFYLTCNSVIVVSVDIFKDKLFISNDSNALFVALLMTRCPSPALSVCVCLSVCVSVVASTQLAHFLVFLTTHFSRELISVAK